VQVWDRNAGWKVRPYLNRNEVENYTAAEVSRPRRRPSSTARWSTSRGRENEVALGGTEVVEEQEHLQAQADAEGGEQIHLWIDAKSFLEAKIDGEPRRMDGRMRKWLSLPRFQARRRPAVPAHDGDRVESVKGSHKMTIQAIKVNPPLDDSLFRQSRSWARSAMRPDAARLRASSIDEARSWVAHCRRSSSAGRAQLRLWRQAVVQRRI